MGFVEMFVNYLSKGYGGLACIPVDMIAVHEDINAMEQEQLEVEIFRTKTARGSLSSPVMQGYLSKTRLGKINSAIFKCFTGMGSGASKFPECDF